jgi:dsDNA-specific endonuclease/ATPase MutS2
LRRRARRSSPFGGAEGGERAPSDERTHAGAAPVDASVADGPDAVVELPITGDLDLHPFSPREIPSVVEEYVRACRALGIHEVRLAHGKGKGVQRAIVQRLLRSLPEVVSISDAAPTRGGWGATVARLRPREEV